MRPPELWDPKKDDGPPKRPRNNRKRKATGAPHNDQESEYSAQPTQQVVQISEPILIEDADDTPVQTSRRAVTPSSRQLGDANIEGWVDAVRASQRRIQSSPVKREGTMDSPIELDNSPCPERRALFARPPILESGELGAALAAFDAPPSGKENLTPKGTPKTPKRRCLSNSDNRTPTRSVSRRSPNSTLTPQKQSSTSTTTLQLSPTSDLLNRLISEGNDPQVSSTEFNSWFNVDSEGFTTDDLMPSSPPPFFGLYEDGNEDGSVSGGVWSEFIPEGTGEDFDELDGILGPLEPNILEGQAKGMGTISVVGNEGALGMVDFSGYFRDQEAEREKEVD